MHVLPDLAFLERKYDNSPVAVVGVHSAKFDNEKDSQAIKNAGESSAWQSSPASVLSTVY